MRLLDRPAFPARRPARSSPWRRSANPESLYTWARPDLVVVSQRPPVVGTRDPLEVLEPRGISLFRTWQRGAIRIRWEPGRLLARGFLDQGPPVTPPGTSSSIGLSRTIRASFWLRGLVGFVGFLLGLAVCLGMTMGLGGAAPSPLITSHGHAIVPPALQGRRGAEKSAGLFIRTGSYLSRAVRRSETSLFSRTSLSGSSGDADLGLTGFRFAGLGLNHLGGLRHIGPGFSGVGQAGGPGGGRNGKSRAPASALTGAPALRDFEQLQCM